MLDTMNILFTICGRAGSKGLKNKNLSVLLGKPLVYYTISAIDLFAKSQKVINDLHYDIVLNTDSEALIDIVKNNKMQKIDFVDRKDKLAGDTVGKIDVIADTYFEMKKKHIKDYDLVIDLDITSPLRKKQDLENLINKYLESNVDVVFSVTESRRNPYFNMVCRENGKVKRVMNSQFTARQQAPTIYDMNASLYAYKPLFLEKKVSIFDGDCEFIEMFDTAVLDIDKPLDLEFIDVIAKYLVANNIEFAEVYNNIVL